MSEVGGVLIIIGSVLMGVGGVGMTIMGIIAAFGISAPLGFLAILFSGLVWIMIGGMVADA